MAEEPTSTDLLDAIRAALDALNAGDLDAAVAIYSKDAVFDRSVGGMEVLEGREAIRGFAADWTGAYEDYEQELVEFRDLGHGVTFGVAHQRGRLKGSGGLLQLRFAAVTEWVNGKIERQTSYLDIDEARAAAERLAEERG